MKITIKNTLGVSATLMILPFSLAYSAQTNLGSYGQTQLQQDTGDAVQFTCGGFVQAETPAGTTPLFDTCRAMVHTGNNLSGTGANKDSLGLNEDELAASLQQIATEEFGSTQSMASEISNNQINSSISRLVELRSGVKGFSFAGLLPKQNNQPYKGGAAGIEGNKLGGFISANYGFGERDSTLNTNGFDYDSIGLTGGMDYRIDTNMIIGAMLSYHDISSDFNQTTTVAGGDVQAKGWGGSLYGTYYTDQAYIDLSMGYGTGSYDTKRNIIIPSHTTVAGINQTATGDTDSSDFSASVGAGYDYSSQALTYGPYFRLSYLSVDIDGYSESGAEASGLNLNVTGQKWESLSSVLGAKFSYSLSHSFGVVVPQASIGWVHEYESDAQNVTATYVDDPRQNILTARTNNPDRDYFEVNLGVSVVLREGAQIYASYDSVVGLNDLTQHFVSVGGRWEF